MPQVSGPIHTWRFKTHSRLYSTVTLPFKDAVSLMRVNAFNGLSNKGEQRVQSQTHVNALAAAVSSGEFTPTPWSCNVPPHLQDRLNMGPDTFSLELGEDEFLSQTDGGGRRRALEKLLKDAETALAKESAKPVPDKDVVASCELIIEDIRDLPVTVTIFLDGEPPKDFLNLQKGRPVDKATIFCMESATDAFDDPAYNSAVEIARILHSDKSSPFVANIRLDSLSKCPLPISTLCAKGSSDLSTSLIGLAIIGEYLGLDNRKLAACVTRIFTTIEKRYPDLLQSPSPIAPLSNSGTKAASTMWCGLGILLALKAGHESLDLHSQELSEVCYEVLGHVRIDGNFNAGMKRAWMGELATAYFKDWAERLHQGVPLVLAQQLSPTAYKVGPLRKEDRITRS